MFGAYTTDNKHVRLARYGGGTVAVGSLASVTPVTMGVATGIDGRIWVMWGSDTGKIAVTRSNKTVTRFEPIQQLTDRVLILGRLYGDGRLGPLDMLDDELHDTTPTLPFGVYHAREASGSCPAGALLKAVNNPSHQVTGHALAVTVTDAGDAGKGDRDRQGYEY